MLLNGIGCPGQILGKVIGASGRRTRVAMHFIDPSSSSSSPQEFQYHHNWLTAGATYKRRTPQSSDASVLTLDQLELVNIVYRYVIVRTHTCPHWWNVHIH